MVFFPTYPSVEPKYIDNLTKNCEICVNLGVRSFLESVKLNWVLSHLSVSFMTLTKSGQKD